MQCIDHDSRRDYFHLHHNCAICLVECPFGQAGYHKIRAHFKGNPDAPQFRIPLSPPSVAVRVTEQTEAALSQTI